MNDSQKALNKLFDITDDPKACRLYDIIKAEQEAMCKENAKKLTNLEDVLIKVEEYFDNIADAEYDQDGLVPNEEMRILTEIRAALAEIRKSRTIEKSSIVEPVQFSITGERV